MKKSLFYLIPKIIGIILVAPFAILVHAIAGTWEAIMAIYEAIREVYQVYTGELPDIDDHHEWSSCAWCGDKNAEHINGKCQTCAKYDKSHKNWWYIAGYFIAITLCIPVSIVWGTIEGVWKAAKEICSCYYKVYSDYMSNRSKS